MLDKSFKRDENGCITLLNGVGICFDNETGRRKKYEKLAKYEDKLERGELVSVVRCKDCLYYHKAHILCNDGTERDILEFTKEALDFTGAFVTSKYGINVGGKCELEKNCGYAEDKSVFRQPNDYCGHGERSGENV